MFIQVLFRCLHLAVEFVPSFTREQRYVTVMLFLKYALGQCRDVCVGNAVFRDLKERRSQVKESERERESPAPEKSMN